ncbi:MAG: hypothetical protein A2158_01870 [Chloroflexi bacterium RBG_13_46_14]|nr:MAG: hypothetical protein A2158_01870 [Chloroflexi bacterium RBG_13_46_14]
MDKGRGRELGFDDSFGFLLNSGERFLDWIERRGGKTGYVGYGSFLLMSKGSLLFDYVED